MVIIFSSLLRILLRLCAQNHLRTQPFEETSEKLKEVEAQIVAKRNDLHQFEIEYRKALACYNEVVAKLNQEKQSVDELLKERESIHSSFTITPPVNSSGSSGSSIIKVPNDQTGVLSPYPGNGSVDGKDKSNNKKRFNLNLSF